jgi:cytochrome c556
VKPRTALLMAALLPLCVGSCAQPSPNAGQPTVQGQSMQRMLADVNGLRTYVYGTGTRDQAVQAATDLLEWSRRMGELFPPGVAASEYVDMSPQRAGGAAAAMSGAADRLLAQARSGTRAQIGDQLARTERDGCGFCHLCNTR